MNVTPAIATAAWLGKFFEGTDSDQDLAKAMLPSFAEALNEVAWQWCRAHLMATLQLQHLASRSRGTDHLGQELELSERSRRLAVYEWSWRRFVPTVWSNSTPA